MYVDSASADEQSDDVTASPKSARDEQHPLAMTLVPVPLDDINEEEEEDEIDQENNERRAQFSKKLG